jgi:hypothetical protein
MGTPESAHGFMTGTVEDQCDKSWSVTGNALVTRYNAALEVEVVPDSLYEFP